MAAPRGNRNGAKGKQWEQALKRALARAADRPDLPGTVDRGLDKVADHVISLAFEGDMDAIREVACRIDGKPTEHVQIDQEVTVNVGDSDSLQPKLEQLLHRRSQPTVQ